MMTLVAQHVRSSALVLEEARYDLSAFEANRQ